VVVVHAGKQRPWHDLEKVTIGRGVDTSSDGSAGTGRMDMIKVRAAPHDLNKLGKGVASCGKASFIRRQIAREDVCKPEKGVGKEIKPSAQVGRGVDLERVPRPKEWNPTVDECGSRAGAAAPVAVGLCIDDVAAESHQFPVFTGQIQGYRRYLKTDL